MSDKQVNYPNVNLKGKRNKQKGEKEASQRRYEKKNPQ